MKKKEWNEGLDHIDPDLVEKYVLQKDRLRQKNKKVWLRFGAIAACLALILSAVIVVPMLREDDPDVNRDDNTVSYIPIVNIQAPSSAPQYYGSGSSQGNSGGAQGEIGDTGISVTAKFLEALPDTYTFYDDWSQHEYRIVRMKTVKLLVGTEAAEEFYYLIPIDNMTDFSLYDSFVITQMAQTAYENSVVYNKTQGKAERLSLVLYRYRVYGYTVMGEKFMAFDSKGNFDNRLWNSNAAWKEDTSHSKAVGTITQVEKRVREQDSYYGPKIGTGTLKNISGEAAEVLSYVQSFENGLFVPKFGLASSTVLFKAQRYINGFSTNETVSVFGKEYTGKDPDTYAFTKARFNEDDMNRLPDLNSACETVIAALNSGSVTPPNFNNQEKLRNTLSGVFGWYAKTENGVIGIVRVTWCFATEKYKLYYDDAYYIVEYGSDVCKSIGRDALLELLGEYEATHIYTGKYNEYGKDFERVYY